MSSKVINIVLFILYKNSSYELASAKNMEDLADFVIENFDDIDSIYLIDEY